MTDEELLYECDSKLSSKNTNRLTSKEMENVNDGGAIQNQNSDSRAL